MLTIAQTAGINLKNHFPIIYEVEVFVVRSRGSARASEAHSHVKLKKPGAPTIVLPGNRPVVSPGVVKQALDAIAGYPISRLPDLLSGRL